MSRRALKVQTFSRRPVWACSLLLALPALAEANCTLSIVDVSFGNYDTFNPAPTDISGSVGIACDAEVSLQISLSAGVGSFSDRRMVNGANALFYNLFTDPARLSIWGDGSPGTSVLSLSGLGGTFTVYGRIPPRQNVAVGAYGDTITVTLTF